MKKIMELITEELAEAFQAAGYDKEYAKVTLSNRPDLCEYQCNGAMAGAKAYRKAPVMIANDVAAGLEGSRCLKEVKVVNPGFINLKLNREYVAEYLNQMSADENMGLKTAEEPRTIVVDYGGPNVAKPLHVGHLRSAIIGEGIKRLARKMGQIGRAHV